MDRVIGIDLGTTNSVVAYYEQGQVVVIPNSEGARTTPSVVYFKSPDEIVVGELARRHVLTHPKQTVRSIKRFMGGRFSEVADKQQGIGYDLVEGPEDSILVDVGWGRFSPEQVSGEILKKMKLSAEDYFGETVEKAVITVPAYFNDSQRCATKRAGELAGLEVIRIINEPTAAALAFGLNKSVEQRIAVFDLGGGTFDLSVLELDQDVFEVKSTRGDTFLGGDNIDEIVFEDVLKRFAQEAEIDLSDDLQAVQRVREAAEKLKCELSTTTEAVLSLPFIAARRGESVHLNDRLTRERFQELIEPLKPRLLECCRGALADARMKPAELDHVLLVGGSTRIPGVQEWVRRYFGREPNRTLNPDEAVAMGAAIQGSILSGGLREVLLLDVTSLSLGIELAEDVYSVLIPRNSSIPTAVHKTFTTVRDNQISVKIHVLQGERKIASENQSLGYFRLVGITPSPKEIPEINVTFQIDANGILSVSATDATSGVTNSVVIENYTMLSEEDAEEVVRAAESAADEDRKFMRRTYLKNQADQLMKSFEEVLADTNDPLDPETAKAIREAMFKFDLAYSTDDVAGSETSFSHMKQLAALVSDRLLMLRLRDGS